MAQKEIGWKSTKKSSRESDIARNEAIYHLDFFASRSSGRIFYTLKDFFWEAMFDSPSGKGKYRLALDLFDAPITQNNYYSREIGPRFGSKQELDFMLALERIPIIGGPKYIGQAHFLKGEFLGGDALISENIGVFSEAEEFKDFIQKYFNLESYQEFAQLFNHPTLPQNVQNNFRALK